MNKKLLRKRFFAVAIDCIISMSIIFFILSIVLLSSNGIVNSWLTKHNLMGLIIYLPFMSMILLKDVFGRSLGKRFLGLTIVDTETKHHISVYRRISRNITLLIFPVDVYYFFQNNIRLGDILSKTEVAEITNNNTGD
jgi:uncharacterized RDD family membrane protein YckC